MPTSGEGFMQTPAVISFRNFPRSDAVASRIERKYANLSNITIELLVAASWFKHPIDTIQKAKLYQVHIHLGLPGDDIVVGKIQRRS